MTLIYPQPAPETLGLTLAADSATRVEAVAEGSVAATAGIRAGDELRTLSGQSLISAADVSWALHGAPESGSLPVTIQRGGAEKSLILKLADGWRVKSDISRRVGTWPMRGMATGGLVLEDLADDARTQRGLGAQQMALWVKGLGQYGKHAAAKNAGFQKEDVVVELDGLKKRMTEGELIGHLLRNRKAGERVKATVLRGTERKELTLPMQ